MLSAGHILILDLVVANLFMHSLSDMILLYLVTVFTPKVLLHEIYYHFCKACAYRFRITDTQAIAILHGRN